MKVYRFRVLASYDVAAESKSKAEERLASALPPQEGDTGIEWNEGKLECVEVIELTS